MQEVKPDKLKFYDFVIRTIGEILDIPPMEYCFYQYNTYFESLYFTNGNTQIRFTRSSVNGKVGIMLDDEIKRPMFYNLREFRYLMS